MRICQPNFKPVGILFAVTALFGCGGADEKSRAPDPKWEAAHATALSVIELINVKRAATDRSYYYPREVADCDSDGVYEAIVGWHPSGGPDGTDLLWRVVGDTMTMSPDSAVLWHAGMRMHFDLGIIRGTYPIWQAGDSVCCPSGEVQVKIRVIRDRAVVISQDSVVKKTSTN